MADEDNGNGPSAAEPTAPSDVTITTLRDAVEEQLKGSGSVLIDRLKDYLVETERTRRVDLLIKGWMFHKNIETDLNKVNRSDVKTFNADGGIQTESYSEKRVKEIKELKERINRIRVAMHNAINKADYKKLEEILKNTPRSPAAQDGSGKPAE